MALEVRPIAADELVPWVEVLHVAFHDNRPAADDVAYRRDVFEQDYERSLAAVDGDKIVGTLESFPAELTLPGDVVVTADAISAVSVLPTHRRRGALSSLITADLRAQKERGEIASILQPSEYPIYGRFGFGPATLRVEYTIDTAAARFTRPATGQVEFIEPKQLREIAPSVFDRFRRRRPGQIDRTAAGWDARLGVRETPWARRDGALRCATYTSPAGELDGYLMYRTEENRQPNRFSSRLEVPELITLTSEAYLALWRFCCEIDLVSEVRALVRCTDEPLYWLLENPRAAMQETRRTDFLWLRSLDTPRLFGSRKYQVEDHLVLEVTDPARLSGGRYWLEAGPSGSTCQPTQKSADISLDMTALGAITLGGQNLHVMAEAGLIEEQRPGAVFRAHRMFGWPVTPWCSTHF